ncbi:C-type mannose receptor 2-like [Patiria miniata]|uniref:C-type lectin domain-containing protein n=1 Tax=Patiria miniata TaxID=46514 RepID=A0A913ZYI5_PATMI|nr:C-type mannose receptor 2-like [Patiria miniata]
MNERVVMLMFLICFASGLLPGGLGAYTQHNPATGFTFIVFESLADETNSWYDARAKCRIHSEYADLAEITAPSDVTTVENLLTNSQAASTSFWFGIYDHLSENAFKSLYDGSDITFEKWDGGRPKNDANKNCGTVVSSNSRWRDEACTGSKMRGVLCRMLTPIPPSSIDPNTGCRPTMVPFGGLCYDFRLLGIGNFSHARQACEAHPSGRMVVPNGQTEADFVHLYAMLTGQTDFWLGITDEYIDDDLRSIYGPDLSYDNWHATGSGVILLEIDCAYIDAVTGDWYTDNCGELKSIMCTVVPPSQGNLKFGSFVFRVVVELQSCNAKYYP